MPNIFISYRRADSQHFTDRLHERLSSFIEDDEIFLDISNIPLGISFRNYIKQQIEKSDVVLVIISSRWVEILEERKDDHNDFVRIEIEEALKQCDIVIPILVEDTQMPSPENLDDAIKELQDKQSKTISRKNFDNDVKDLWKGIQHSLDYVQSDRKLVSEVTVLEAFEAWQKLNYLDADDYLAIRSNLFDDYWNYLETANVRSVQGTQITVYVNTDKNKLYFTHNIRKAWFEKIMTELIGKKITLRFESPNDIPF